MQLKVSNISKDFILKGDHHSGGSAQKLKALDNISFSATQGDIIGIIGKNGSGKSTLLKILSGIYKPTSGSIEISGRVLSILEVGTGFHPDLSGKENVFLNGRLHGLADKRINEIFERIKEFSEIGIYIDEPVKNYSSGMYFRLAFSIVVYMESDVILLDEVLSVGDESFRKKCLEKIKNDLAVNRIVLIASHDIRDLRSICNKGIFISKGKIVTIGSFKEALNEYLNFLDAENSNKSADSIAKYSYEKSGHKVVVNAVEVNNCLSTAVVRIDRSSDFKISIRLEKLVDEVLDLVLYLGEGLDLFMSDSIIYRKEYNEEWQAIGKYLLECTIPGNFLNTGIFDVTIIIGNRTSKIVELHKIAKFRIIPSDWEEDKKWNDESSSVVVRPNLFWEIKSI